MFLGLHTYVLIMLYIENDRQHGLLFLSLSGVLSEVSDIAANTA